MVALRDYGRSGGPAFRHGVCAMGEEETDRRSWSVLQGRSPVICSEGALVPQVKENGSGQVQRSKRWCCGR